MRYTPVLFSNEKLEQLVHVIHKGQHITSYEMFVEKGHWRDLEEVDEDVEERKLDGKEMIGVKVDGMRKESTRAGSSTDWAGKLEGMHSIDDGTLGA